MNKQVIACKNVVKINLMLDGSSKVDRNFVTTIVLSGQEGSCCFPLIEIDVERISMRSS